jgi:hypothetical protein
MKKLAIVITSALTLFGCDARVSTAPPVVEKNTTVVNPPAKEEKKVETNTTVVNPPAGTTTEKKETTVTK